MALKQDGLYKASLDGILDVRQGMEGEDGVTTEALVWSYLKKWFKKEGKLEKPSATYHLLLTFLNTSIKSCTTSLIQLYPLLVYIIVS